MTQEQLNEGNRLVKDIQSLKTEANEIENALNELRLDMQKENGTVYLYFDSKGLRVSRSAFHLMLNNLWDEIQLDIRELEGKLKEL